ncbi:MAG TPA: patatin-like phospholipase family protein [Rhodanobacteraceae bacterium]|nr:patatin-like phospholipase family protein [Rhodanobacteraceae bacterium]
MLQLDAERPARNIRDRARIGLAVAGGGPIGGMWELGALHALADSIDGLDLTDLRVYVGVSSGSFLAAGLANGLDTAEMARIFLTGDSHEAVFHPESFVRPALFEYMKRAAGMPRVMLDWVGDITRNPLNIQMSDALLRLGSLLPTGLFDNESVEAFLRKLFTGPGRSNDFRELERTLFLIAVELDSGKAVRLGGPGLDDVPISRAVEASAALPGLYPPVQIGERWYVDGALARTLHASAALDQGATLVLAVNPLVPYNADRAPAAGRSAPESLIAGGLPAVLSQTFRTLLTSRMQTGLGKYAKAYPQADMLLFEPRADDVELFFTNLFSYSHRRRVAELAWRVVRADLQQHAEALAPLLARHGLGLHHERLAEIDRSLEASLRQQPARAAVTASLSAALNDLDGALRHRKKASAPMPKRVSGRRRAAAIR